MDLHSQTQSYKRYVQIDINILVIPYTHIITIHTYHTLTWLLHSPVITVYYTHIFITWQTL